MKSKKNLIMIIAIVIFIIIICGIPIINYKLNTNLSLKKYGLQIETLVKKNKNNYIKDKNTLILSSNDELTIDDQKYLEFKVSGTSEVLSNISYSITGESIFLKAGTYRDMTTNDINITFTLEDDYYPIEYTLIKNDMEIAKGKLDDIKNEFNNIQVINKGNKVNDTYKLYWKWVSTNSKADNYLNKALEGAILPTSEKYNITENVKVEIKIDKEK